MLFQKDVFMLLAMCHLRNGLRSFALDAIRACTVTSSDAYEVPLKEVDAFVGQGYGIFSGADIEWATLRFTAERARWVSGEQWHPLQEVTWESDGRLEMKVPFTDQRELMLEVLRHGSHVEVVAPESLRNSVLRELNKAAAAYNCL